MSLARRQDRKWRRDRDREEAIIRRAARHRHCYQCVIDGRGKVPAIRGELCQACFDAVGISHPGVTPL